MRRDLMKNGYTIIELLVAIAVVIVLSAMLFPVLKGSGQRAAKAQGLSKIQQLSNASLAYLSDNNEVFPVGCNCEMWHPDQGWEYSLKPYLGTFQKLLVADDPQNKASWPTWVTSQPDSVNISFVSNGYLALDEDDEWGMQGVMGVDQAPSSCDGGGWMSRGVTALSDVSHTTDTVMFAQAYNAYPLWFTSDIISGVDWWDSSGFGGLLPDSTRDGSPYVVNGVVQTADNRNGAINSTVNGKFRAIWVDGHFSSVTPASTNPNHRKPQNNKWWATRP